MAPEADLVTEAAARWFIRLQQGPSEQEREAFERWLDDPASAVAYARVEATWDRTERLKAISVPIADRSQESLRSMSASGSTTAAITRRAAMMALSAGGAAGAVWWMGLAPMPSYATTIGERKRVKLADGSAVELNTASRVTADISGRHRTLELSKGEAFFEIVARRGLPFEVTAGRARIFTDASAFNIRMRDNVVELLVGRGELQVGDRSQTGQETSLRPIAAGEGARIYAGSIEAFALRDDELAQRIAWLHGILEFNGDTLAQAVAEFNRYRTSPIVIADPNIAGMRIGGTFQTNESAKFIESMALLGVKSTTVSGATTYLSAAAKQKL